MGSVPPQHEGDSAERSPGEFYDALAPSYDAMVQFGRRVERAGRLVAALAERFRPEPAAGVDLGCGTGAYTCALAAAGFRAAGLDIAEGMLARARANAAALGLKADFARGGLEALPDPFQPGAAGLVLCLGNTLPHLTDPCLLAQALAGIAALLSPGGVAVLQALNYDRILGRGERIVSADRDAGATYLRFYDFLGDGLLRFNVLRVTWEGDRGRPDPLLSVLLRGYRRRDLETAAAAAGLEVALAAGNDALDPWDAEASETLVLVCRRVRP